MGLEEWAILIIFFSSYLQVFKNHMTEIDYVKDKAIFENLFNIYDLNQETILSNPRRPTLVK